MTSKFSFLFPGQGSQKIGMGKEICKEYKIAKQVFDEVDDVLGKKLSSIIFDGNESELTKTVNAQPALMTVSIAILRVIEHEVGKKISEIVSVVAGHSLGEYTALCGINSISLKDTANLLHIRGKAMQDCVSNQETKMVAILGLNIKLVENILIESKNFKNDQICEIANDNCLGQVVLSGHSEKLEIIKAKCKENGAKGVIDLKVSAPFHCSLMHPVAETMKKSLEFVDISNPKTKFVNNVNAKFVEDNKLIKELLVKQVSNRVRWRESINLINDSGVKKMIEIGSGKVLTNLNKRMGLDLEANSIQEVSDVQNFLRENFK